MLVVVSRLSVFDSGCVIIRSVRGCDAAGVVALVVGSGIGSSWADGEMCECKRAQATKIGNLQRLCQQRCHSSLPALSRLAPKAWQTPQDFPTFSAVQPEVHKRLEGRQAQPAAVEGFSRRLSPSGQQASHRGQARLVVDSGDGSGELHVDGGWGNPDLASGRSAGDGDSAPLPSPVGPGVFDFFPQWPLSPASRLRLGWRCPVAIVARPRLCPRAAPIRLPAGPRPIYSVLVSGLGTDGLDTHLTSKNNGREDGWSILGSWS